MSLVVGLTGGIASGKSHVLKVFQSLGVPHIEADDVGRAVVAPGEPALAEIAQRFGAEMLLPDGTLDRVRMRKTVFQDAAALSDLNAITHPHIRRQLRRWIEQQTAPYCVLAAAILLESGLRKLVDEVLVVDAPEGDQLQRLVRRDGIALDLAKAMLARQASRAERLAAAHAVIENGEPLRDVRPQVLALHDRWQRGRHAATMPQ